MENLAHVLAFTRAKCLGRRTGDIDLPNPAVPTLDPLWQALDLDGLPFELAACLLDCCLCHGPSRATRWLGRCLKAEALLTGQAAPLARDGRLGASNRSLLTRSLLRPGLGLRLAHGVLSRRADHARRHPEGLPGEARRVESLRRALAGERSALPAGLPSAPSPAPAPRPATQGGFAHA